MESATFDLYRDIAERTDGDVYLGVVGPVRTGKSTFITRLMELLVMPKIPEGARKERIADELPQSGSGRTIMTTQPQFVPSEAVTVSLSDNAPVRVRLVDSVGYMVRGALGSVDKTGSRMVHTPWYDHDIPFEQAAEVGPAVQGFAANHGYGAGGPHFGQRRDDLDQNIRAFVVRPYVIFYELSAGGIHVAHIVHGARDFPLLFE